MDFSSFLEPLRLSYLVVYEKLYDWIPSYGWALVALSLVTAVILSALERQVANAVPEGDGAGVFADIVAVHQAYAPRALPAGTLVEDKVRRLGVQVESSCLVCGADEPSAFAVEVADVSA